MITMLGSTVLGGVMSIWSQSIKAKQAEQKMLIQRAEVQQQGFKEARELKELDLRLPMLEKKKIYLEKKISDSDVDISEISHELAELIESIQKHEDRWIELSEMSESAK